jgi:hypothetical protein
MFTMAVCTARLLWLLRRFLAAVATARHASSPCGGTLRHLLLERRGLLVALEQEALYLSLAALPLVPNALRLLVVGPGAVCLGQDARVAQLLDVVEHFAHSLRVALASPLLQVPIDFGRHVPAADKGKSPHSLFGQAPQVLKRRWHQAAFQLVVVVLQQVAEEADDIDCLQSVAL